LSYYLEGCRGVRADRRGVGGSVVGGVGLIAAAGVVLLVAAVSGFLWGIVGILWLADRIRGKR
jgi:hypothetical protein